MLRAGKRLWPQCSQTLASASRTKTWRHIIKSQSLHSPHVVRIEEHEPHNCFAPMNLEWMATEEHAFNN